MTPQELLKSVQTGLEDHGGRFAGIAVLMLALLVVFWKKSKHDGKAGAGEGRTNVGGADKENREETQEEKPEEEKAGGEKIEEKGKEEPGENLERGKAEEEPEEN